MIWLEIITRIFFGLCCIGFVLGMTLWHKHPIFEKVGVYTGFLIVAYGLAQMFVHTILGF